MAVAPRSNKKATRIAFSLIGIPDNMKECYKGFRKISHQSKESVVDNNQYNIPNTNSSPDGGFYSESY